MSKFAVRRKQALDSWVVSGNAAGLQSKAFICVPSAVTRKSREREVLALNEPQIGKQTK